jgi:putrescine transport system substrate-binding protein
MRWVDNLAIPKDAVNVEQAHAYLNYMLDPQIAADNANYVMYPTPNKTAFDKDLIDKEAKADPLIYPPKEIFDNLFDDKVASPEVDQLRTRTWTAVKTGQ